MKNIMSILAILIFLFIIISHASLNQQEEPIQHDLDDYPVKERTTTKWPLFNDSSYNYILGLFSKQTNPMSITPQERAMFMSAIILSQQYNITVNGKQFAYHLEETNERDEIDALDRTCLSITQNQILGIVGPTGSSETKATARFCNRIGLPVFGHSSTAPGLSDRNAYKTFYRMSASDTIMAKALLKLFEKYDWNSTNIIYQGDQFGLGGLQAFTEMFRDKIKISTTIKYDLFTDQIKDFRRRLRESPSRIVLLWATANITTRIIQLAIEEGDVLAPDFLWIMTAQSSQMQFNDEQLSGMLLIRPVSPQAFDVPINETLLNHTIDIWKAYDPESYIGDESHIDAYALYAFDSAWLLILALNKLCEEEPSDCPTLVNTSHCFASSLTNREKLHDIIEKMEFLGVSGHIQFVENTTDRLVEDSSHFIIDNLQPLTRKRILLHAVKVLKFSDRIRRKSYEATPHWIEMQNEIEWPRGLNNKPVDYALLTNITLNITVHVSPPFYMEKIRNYSNGTSAVERDGYIFDLILLLEERMHFIKNITVAPIQIRYNELVDCVENGTYEIVMADLTQTASRSNRVDFSVSIYDNTMRLVIRKSKKMRTPIMAFLQPFHYSLWLGVLGICLVSMIIIATVEYIVGSRRSADAQQSASAVAITYPGIGPPTDNNPYVSAVYDTSMIKTFFRAMYYTIGNLVQRDSEFHTKTIFGRCQTVIVWLISVVLIALFTSNMVQYFTAEREKSWIQSIEDLKMCGKIGCRRIGILERSQHADYFKKEVTNNIDMNYYPLNNQTECYTKLLDHQIDVAIADSSSADYFTQTDYCDLEETGLPFGRTEFAIAVPKKWAYKEHLDKTLLDLKESGAMDNLLSKWFQQKNCDHKNEAKNNAFGNGLELEGTQGLFIVFIVLTTINLLAFIFYELSFFKRTQRPSTLQPNSELNKDASEFNDPTDGIQLVRQTRYDERRSHSGSIREEFEQPVKQKMARRGNN